MTSIFRFLLTCSTLVFASGCFFITPPAQGDLSFLWSFNGEARCLNAGVDQVEVTIFNSTNQKIFSDTYTCIDGGLNIPNIDVGQYILVLNAFGFSDDKLYEGQQSIIISGNVVNDIGYVNLARVQAEILEGEVVFRWGFLYPSSKIETDCARAGVDFVDVRLAPAASNSEGEVFEKTFSCEDAGAAITTTEGEYILTLDAYKSGSPDLLLYQSQEVEVVIIYNDPLDLGDITCDRVEESFGDISIDWSLPQTCAELGVTSIDFSITRVSIDFEELSFSLNCDAEQTEVIDVVVPGSYLIEASSVGTDDSFFGSKTFTVEPNITNDVNVDLLIIGG